MNIVVVELDDALYQRLTRDAQANKRTLEGEIRYRLRQAPAPRTPVVSPEPPRERELPTWWPERKYRWLCAR